MAAYQFAVVGADQSILLRSEVELESCRAAWAQVVSLAWRFGDIKAQIKVANSEGKLVIVTGVRAAQEASQISEKVA